MKRSRVLALFFILPACTLVGLGSSDAQTCPNGRLPDSVGFCRSTGAQGQVPPADIIRPVIEVTGFPEASIVVPNSAFMRLVKEIALLRSQLDGVSDGKARYEFDILNVTGLYDSRPLTAEGKLKVFKEVEQMGLLNFIPDLSGDGIIDSRDVSDPLLGQLRVHSLRKKLVQEGVSVRLSLPQNTSKIPTIAGPAKDDPNARGVTGELAPTRLPN